MSQKALRSTRKIRWTRTDDSWSDIGNHIDKIYQIVTWMINVKHKYILKTVNKKIRKANTHMKWYYFWSESPSDFYYTNRYGSLNHPMGRPSNHLWIGSTTGINPNLLLSSSDRTNESETLPHTTTCTRKHKYT